VSTESSEEYKDTNNGTCLVQQVEAGDIAGVGVVELCTACSTQQGKTFPNIHE
jgi:hypothetical protein